MLTLKIKPLNQEIAQLYAQDIKNYKSDLGFDLYIPEDITVPAKGIVMIDHMVQTELANVMDFKDGYTNKHYFLVPRSSIYKKGLILMNSIGVIDKGYRGNLMAVVHNVTDEDVLLKRGERLFQLIYLSSWPIDEVYITNRLSETERGERGLGSTGS